MDAHHPVLVFYNFHSVPMPSSAVKQLFTFATSNLPGEPNRSIFACDVRRIPQDVLDTVEAISKCEVEHFSVHRIDHLLPERILRYTSLCGSSRGTVALITGSGDGVKTVKELRENGWEVVVFHPPEVSTILLEAASRAVALPIHCVSDSTGDENSCKDEDTRKVSDLIKKDMSSGKKKNAEIDGWGVPIAAEIRAPRPLAPPSPFGNGFNARSGPPRPMAPHQTRNPFAQQDPPHQARNPFAHQDAPHQMRNPFAQHDAPHQIRNPFAQKNSCDRPNPFNKNPFDASSGDSFSPRRPGKPPGNRGGFGMAATAEGEAPTRKLGPQCPHWEDRVHSRKDMDCDLYHPRKPCRYFPNCKLAAMVCYYAHPFCSDGGECTCKGGKNPQLNHIRS